MAAAPSVLDEVLALAKGLKVLRKDQLARILEHAPGMSEAELEKVKAALLKIKAVRDKEMKENMEVLRGAASAHKEWQADKARAELAKKESTDQASEESTAEALLQTLNS